MWPVVRVSITPAERFNKPQLSQYTYGFVGFHDERSVRNAVSWFHGKKLHGRPIIVEETHHTRLQTNPYDKQHKAQEPTEREEGHVTERNYDVLSESDVKERMQYIRKCYEDTAATQPDLKLPAWSELEKRIQRQTYSLSQPFTFPVEPVEVDLAEIDKLVRKTSLSS